jgi:hypothetical protein
MLSWASRADRHAARTFISYSVADVHLVVPPGGRLGAECADDHVEGDGLWQHATWSLDDAPLIDRDPPSSVKRVRTIVVICMLGDEFRGEIAELLRGQLEQVWMVLTPEPDRPLPDRRAHQHAALLMRLTDEAREAFPDEVFWQPVPPVGFDQVPDDYAQLLQRIRPAWPTFEVEPSLGTRVLFLALLRAVWQRLRGRPGVRPSELTVWADAREWTCGVAAPVGPSQAARLLEHDRRPVISPH